VLTGGVKLLKDAPTHAHSFASGCRRENAIIYLRSNFDRLRWR